MRKSIILSLFLLLFSVTAYAEYSDMPHDWSYESMSWAVESGIINGSDGKIYPDGYMTRAEQAAVLARYARQNELFAENGETYTYTDANESDWFYADVCYMSAANIMNGDGERFRPHDNVTREEAVAAMGRMLSIEEDEEACQTFSDIDEISDWARGCVGAFAELGLVNGDGGEFRPHDAISRKEFIAILYRCDMRSDAAKHLEPVIDEDGSVWSPIYN